MPKMLMGQIDHARGRVRQITKELLGEAPKKPAVMHVSDMVQALRTGELSFSGKQLQDMLNDWTEEYATRRSTYSSPTLETTLLQNAFTKRRADEQAQYEAELEKYRARQAKVNAEATKVEDAIVLGDQHAALAALQSFAKFRP